MPFEKMSKSRGNVVLPEEVVYGVMELDSKYEFRNEYGEAIDFTKFGIWRDKLNTGLYFTATKFGRLPVFLCEKGDPRPCILLFNRQEIQQHSDLICKETSN